MTRAATTMTKRVTSTKAPAALTAWLEGYLSNRGTQHRATERINQDITYSESHRIRYDAAYKEMQTLNSSDSLIRSFTNELASNVRNYERNVDRYKKELENKIAAETAGGAKEKAEALIASVLKDKRIQSVRLVDDNLLLTTATLSRLKGYELGRFLITIRKQRGGYLMHNLDYCVGDPQRDHYDHPHISRDSGCTGQFGSMLNDLDQQGHLYLFIDAVIGFLSTFALDDGSPYCEFYQWFGRRRPISAEAAKKPLDIIHPPKSREEWTEDDDTRLDRESDSDYD